MCRNRTSVANVDTAPPPAASTWRWARFHGDWGMAATDPVPVHSTASPQVAPQQCLAVVGSICHSTNTSRSARIALVSPHPPGSTRVALRPAGAGVQAFERSRVGGVYPVSPDNPTAAMALARAFSATARVRALAGREDRSAASSVRVSRDHQTRRDARAVAAGAHEIQDPGAA